MTVALRPRDSMSDTTAVPPREHGKFDALIVIAAFAAVTIPLIVAALRNLIGGWIPIGDNAYFVVRSRDVLTQHNPLLGAWSSGSASIETSVNNLGPLQLNLLAPFTKFGPAGGTIVGVTVINIASIAIVAYISRRVAGNTGLAVMMAATATVTWSMGSQILIEPRQHSAMMLPFLCYLVAAWAIASGASWALWIAVVAGSLTLQTHLSYAVLVPMIAVPAIVGLVIAGRRDGWRPEQLRHVAVAAAVALMCWALPLWDQFFGSHNLTNVLGAGGEGSQPTLGTAARLVADIVSLPPWWGRDTYSRFDPVNQLPSATAAWLSLAAVLVMVAAAGFAAWRNHSAVGVSAMATVLVALVAAIVSARLLPTADFGLVAGNYRWLWSLGAFCLGAVVIAGLAGLRNRCTSRRNAFVAVSATAITALFGILNLPSSYQSLTRENGEQRVEVTKDLTAQLAGAEIEGPVLIDRSNGFFGEPYTFATLVELQSLGIEFDFVDDDEIYRWGDGRRPNDDDTVLMTFAYGDRLQRGPEGSTRVAFASAIEADELPELTSLEQQLRSAIRGGDIEFDLDEARDATDQDFAVVQSVLDGDRPEGSFLRFDIEDLLAGGWVSGSDEDLELIERWRTLQRAASDGVAIYTAPLGS